MSDSGQSDGGSSFSTGTGGASSILSNNEDSKALNALQTGPGDEASDLDSSNKSVSEAVFSTVYLISTNKAVDTSWRWAALRILLESLQLFLVLFNPTWSWKIQQDNVVYKAISWLLFKMLWVTHGYQTYISGFYLLTSITLVSSATIVWIAVALKGTTPDNVWLKRLISGLRWLSLLFCSFWWVGMMDYLCYMFDCNWPNLAAGKPVYHVGFTDQNCLALPHLAHMLVAVFTLALFCWNVMLMAVGSVDMNPMTRNHLASSDADTTVKILFTKMLLIILCSALDSLGLTQDVMVAIITAYLMHLHNGGMAYYEFVVNVAWTAVAWALLFVVTIYAGLDFLLAKHPNDPTYAQRITMGVLYGIAPMLLWGAFGAFCHEYLITRPVRKKLRHAYEERKQLAASAAAWEDLDAPEKLRKVYRFRDVRQVLLSCRDMRKWDDEGVPDPEAVAFGVFVLKCGMARFPDNPKLMMFFANYLLGTAKDAQGAQTHLQLAQKTDPSLPVGYSIYAAQQLARELHKDGDALDLVSYVEYQRNYRTCIRAHKAALMAQRQFWSCFMHESVHYKDIQKRMVLMDAADQRALTLYKRVLERYPKNGRLLKVYGRFLENVRHDPWTASKFYMEAQKNGTTESLVNLARGQSGEDVLAKAGNINEKVDGIIVINSRGFMLMLNYAAVAIFGYDKGDLDGKNVSILMPAPFSTMHDNFLRRYVEGGEPHIIGKSRTMVALKKDRVMIPVLLWVTRLSGLGSESLFIGIIRPAVADTSSIHRSVRFWTTATGTIMCTDGTTKDCFGVEASDLVGQPFSSLCTDPDVVERYLLEVATSDIESKTAEEEPGLQTQMLHQYLEPVKVRITTEFGGALAQGHDCRSFVIQVRLESEALSLLSVDAKGRICYTTDKLAAMLGYAVETMARMDLNSLLPQPYCQMHGAWFKELQHKVPPPTSCRAGGIVHLLAANGNKLAVTLSMSTKQHPEKGLLRVIQVTRVDDAAQLNQHCLKLSVNHDGTILETNTGVPSTLYGFNAADIVGRPLAAIIDVFGLWRHKFGEDTTLLMLLASQALQAANTASSGNSWRVGVHKPVPTDAEIALHAQVLETESQFKDGTGINSENLLQKLQQQNRLRAACMSVELLQVDAKLLQQDPSAPSKSAVMKVSLHRADALSTMLELDKDLHVLRADESARLMLAITPKRLVKQSIVRIVGLPPSTTYENLLGQGKAAKKGAMKGGTTAAAAASRMGVNRRIVARHLGDGRPVTLDMQAMSYQQAGKTHQLVRFQFVEPISASFPALLQLKEGKAPVEIAVIQAAVENGDEQAEEDGQDDRSFAGSDADDQDTSRAPAHPESVVDRKLERVSTWVRESSRLPENEYGEDDRQLEAPVDGEDPAGLSGRAPQGHRKPRPSEAASAAYGVAGSEEGMADYAQDDREYAQGEYDDGQELQRGTQRTRQLQRISETESAGAAGSIEDAASEAHETSEAAQDDDLVVDARRAKRLKKLSKLLHSNAAQAASKTWRIHTLLLLAVMLLAHVACFVAFISQVDRRYISVQGVADLARALDGFMVMMLRANLIQKCWLPQNLGTMWACGPAQMKLYAARLAADVPKADTYHHRTYLSGGTGLVDKRMMDYWTYKRLPEYNYFRDYVYPNGSHAVDITDESGETLWVMGNMVTSAGKDLIYTVQTQANDSNVRSHLNETSGWQYIYQNGPKAIYEGYAWSLDTFVDFCWRDMLSLAYVAITLLAVEIVVVHAACILYELWLAQKCNMAHARIFSTFLTLPTATVRQMTQRPLQIGDDTAEDADEDDDGDLMDAAPTAAGEVTASVKAATKSVRMEIADGDSEAVDGKAGRSSSKSKPKRSGAQATKPPQVAKLEARHRRFIRGVVGWLKPRFKKNGKVLQFDSWIIWRFLVPLLLWITAAITIFAVSIDELKGLDQPIAALDTSAHILYRLARTRIAANLLAFSSAQGDNAVNRAILLDELVLFQEEYRTLLYGGNMVLQANVSFNPVAPASVFYDQTISDLFFRTTACLRADKSTCINDPTSPFYNSVHSGLDVMVTRYMQEMTTFSKLPDALAYANHSSYVWVLKVGAADLHDGLETAGELFIQYTVNRLEQVKWLHIILLVLTLVCIFLYILFVYRPFIKQLRMECKTVAGMLSQLPVETDIEGYARSVFYGTRASVAGSSSVIGASGGSVTMPSGGVFLGGRRGSNSGAQGSNTGYGDAAADGYPNPRGSYTGYAADSKDPQAGFSPGRGGQGQYGSYPGFDRPKPVRPINGFEDRPRGKFGSLPG